MDKYINQLIEEIDKLSRKELKRQEMQRIFDSDSEYNPSKISEYIQKEEVIEAITGLDFEKLPMPENLTDEQQALLSDKLSEFLVLFDVYIDFPETLSKNYLYQTIYDIWTEKQLRIFGDINIDFCDDDDDEYCPYKDECTSCHDARQQILDDELKETKRLN